MAIRRRRSVNVWFQDELTSFPYCFNCALERIQEFNVQMNIYADIPYDNDCPKSEKDNRRRECFGCNKLIRD